MKLKCFIVDDEPPARRLLKEFIEDIDYLELMGEAEDPVEANSILQSNTVDLLFLDINMPRMSGIEYLRSTNSKPVTIITSAYHEYALEGYELDVLDYLVKPFSFERLKKSCDKAKDYYTLRKANSGLPATENYFFVKSNGRVEKIYFKDILLIEAMQNYVRIKTESNKHTVYITLKSILDKLPAELFLKIHKSTVINLNKIKNLEGNVVDLGAEKAVISQSLFSTVTKRILNGKYIKD